MASATSKDTKVVTGRVRFSYLHAFQPRAAEEGQEARYGVSLLIPKSDLVTLRKIKAAIAAVMATGAPKWGGKVPPNLKLPLRDGDEERADQPEYQGCWFLNANSKMKPGIVDAQNQPILDSTEVYSGCYGRASINFFAFNIKGNKGIACGLNNLQKLSDGDYLGGRSRPEDDFEPVDSAESVLD